MPLEANPPHKPMVLIAEVQQESLAPIASTCSAEGGKRLGKWHRLCLCVYTCGWLAVRAWQSKRSGKGILQLLK